MPEGRFFLFQPLEIESQNRAWFSRVQHRFQTLIQSLPLCYATVPRIVIPREGLTPSFQFMTMAKGNTREWMLTSSNLKQTHELWNSIYHKNGTGFHNMPYCSGSDTTLWVIGMLLNDRMNFCGTSILVTAYFEGDYKLSKFIHGYYITTHKIER